MVIPVAVSGVRGRMAGIISDACRSSLGLELVGYLACGSAREQTDRRADSNQKGITIFSSLAEIADKKPVVIDFTHITQTRKLLRLAGDACSGLVIGTSGLTAADMARLQELASLIPIVYAANFSYGQWLMAALTTILSRVLPDHWDAQILDLHYKTKADAPSATAKQLAQRWCVEKPESVMPGIAALRVGDGISEHTLYMAGRGERLELAHRVLSREAFLPAILDAVRFVFQRQPGLYSLDDIYPKIKCLASE